MKEIDDVIEIFCCYTHKDLTLLNELKAHLSPLQRSRHVRLWYDGDIVPGADWAEEIKLHLDKADVVLLLISADFIQSDYCYSIEVQRAVERHQVGKACVVPIVLRPVAWKNTPIGNTTLGSLQALPKNAKPVTAQSNHDKAWEEVAEGIERVVNELLRKASPHPTKSEKSSPGLIIPEAKNEEGTFSKGVSQTFSVGEQNINLIILARGHYGPQEVQCFYERKKHLPPDLEEMRRNYERTIKTQKAKGILGLPYDSPMYKLREFELGHRSIVDGEEVPDLRLKFGPTDYFSQIVTDLNVGNPVREKYLAQAAPITEDPVPEFSTILGVNLNVITADNYLVIAERSRQAKVAGGKLHTSVGENLLRPKDSGVSYAPDPFLALTRGAKEELGLVLNRDEIVFSTFTVIPDFCQYSLIATKRIRETHTQVEDIWHNVVPADKWESRRLLFYPHNPDTIAQFVVNTWERWFHVALAAVVLSLLDVGCTWREVNGAFYNAWSKLPLDEKEKKNL